MPVDSRHPDYLEHAPQWQRVRDAWKGPDAVKSTDKKRREEYLPRLSGQTDARYTAYVDSALWYGATKRTVQGLVGAIFRKDPQVILPPKMEAMVRDCTLTGLPLDGFARRLMREMLLPSRYGIWVDWDDKQGRPKFSGYMTEKVTNWRWSNVNGERALTEVRLRVPHVTTDPDDPWEQVSAEQYLVLALRRTEENANPVFVVETWRENPRPKDSKDQWVLAEQRIPMRRQQPLSFIPFVIVNASNIQPDAEEPALLSLVDANFDHFRLDADYKRALKEVSIVQRCTAGFDFGITDDTEGDDASGGRDLNKIPISSDYIWTATDSSAQAFVLSYDGAGIPYLENALQADEKKMATMGARILEQRPQGVESAEALNFRHVGEKSMLGEIVGVAEQGMEKALSMWAWWMGLVDDWRDVGEDVVSYKMNRDYVSARMTSADLLALIEAHQRGRIDDATLYYNLEMGEITMPGDSLEDMQARLAEQEPAARPLRLEEDDNGDSGADDDMDEAA